MIVTFCCQGNVFVYGDESSVRPRPPYTVHATIEEAVKVLEGRGILNVRVLYQVTNWAPVDPDLFDKIKDMT